MTSSLMQKSELLRTRRLLYGEDNPSKMEKDDKKEQYLSLQKNPLLKRLLLNASLAGLNPLSVLHMLALTLGCSVILSAAAVFISPYLALLMPLPFILLHLRILALIKKRAELFEQDYPAFLLALASAVRTGLDPIVAFCRVENLFEEQSVLRQELTQSVRAIERGIAEDEVLNSFAANIAHPDIDLFRTGFVLARKHGSSISQCLQRLVKVTRQRQSFRRKTASAVAMQKLSAIGIACCAGAIAIIQYAVNPLAISQALAHPFGQKAIILGVLLISSGIIWMLHISRRRL